MQTGAELIQEIEDEISLHQSMIDLAEDIIRVNSERINLLRSEIERLNTLTPPGEVGP